MPQARAFKMRKNARSAFRNFNRIRWQTNARLRRTVGNKSSWSINRSIDRLILPRSEIGCRETSIDASSDHILQWESPSSRTYIYRERFPSYVHVFSCKSRFVRRPRKRLSGAVARRLPRRRRYDSIRFKKAEPTESSSVNHRRRRRPDYSRVMIRGRIAAHNNARSLDLLEKNAEINTRISPIPRLGFSRIRYNAIVSVIWRSRSVDLKVTQKEYPGFVLITERTLFLTI